MVYDRIILCLEGSVDETSLVNEAMRLVSAMHASLTVFHVNDPNAGKPHLMMDSLPRVTRKDLLSMFENAGHGYFQNRMGLKRTRRSRRYIHRFAAGPPNMQPAST